MQVERLYWLSSRLECVAGRKPRVARDEQAGVTPLAGTRPGWGRGGYRGAGLAGEGPGAGHSWPPFQPGHTLSRIHGALSERDIVPQAEAIAAAVLEEAQCPDHLRSPAFRASLAGWARAEAVSSLLFDYLATLEVEAMLTLRQQATRAPVDLWRAAEAHAANLRSKLGLDPVSYARIAKDLGITSRASWDALRRDGAGDRGAPGGGAAGDRGR